MGLGADQLEALTECVELINTGRRSAGVSAAGASAAGVSAAGVSAASAASAGAAPADQLAALAGVVAFARRHRVENRSAAHASDVPRLRELRVRLDAIVAACEVGRVQKAIRDLNALLAETGAVPRIVTHDGRPPHIHVSRATAPLADRIAAHSAMGLAELIVAGESGRVRTCASPQCDQVFIDLSRNQSRRYCDSRTCGNRIHVAAYRSRQSALH
jgi:predicted RNA-binding Zn ribbon-like protein